MHIRYCLAISYNAKHVYLQIQQFYFYVYFKQKGTPKWMDKIFRAALFINNRHWKWSLLFNNKMNKYIVLYSYSELLLIHNANE